MERFTLRSKTSHRDTQASSAQEALSLMQQTFCSIGPLEHGFMRNARCGRPATATATAATPNAATSSTPAGQKYFRGLFEQVWDGGTAGFSCRRRRTWC